LRPFSGFEDYGPYCRQELSFCSFASGGKENFMYYFNADDFAVRLKTLRKGKGITQEKTAEELNISLEHLSKMERGKGKPSLDLLVEIAFYFHVSTDYLLLGTDPDKDAVREDLLEVAAQLKEIAAKL
jgi:DNA-binding XRE family transcriptional regulator